MKKLFVALVAFSALRMAFIIFACSSSLKNFFVPPKRENMPTVKILFLLLFLHQHQQQTLLLPKSLKYRQPIL